MEHTNLTEQVFEVAPPLDEVIRHYYCIQMPEGIAEPIVRTLIPNYEVMLVLNFGTAMKTAFNNDAFSDDNSSHVSLLPPLRKTLRYELSGGADAIIMVFTLNGFYRLFGVPINEIADGDIIAPEGLSAFRWLKDLWQPLKKLNRLAARVDLLSGQILRQMGSTDAAFGTIEQSLSYFEDALVQPAKAIASDAQLTQRTVQKRFQKYLGFSPREMLRYLRFKGLLKSILESDAQTIDVLGLVIEHGYHDQSHLAKDFSHFMGTTPRKFMRDVVAKEFCVTKPGKYY